MKKSELRIAWAAVGIFVWLGGLYATIRGLLYHEEPGLFRYGMLAIIVGVTTFVVALNPIGRRGLKKRDHSGQ